MSYLLGKFPNDHERIKRLLPLNLRGELSAENMLDNDAIQRGVFDDKNFDGDVTAIGSSIGREGSKSPISRSLADLGLYSIDQEANRRKSYESGRGDEGDPSGTPTSKFSRAADLKRRSSNFI